MARWSPLWWEEATPGEAARLAVSVAKRIEDSQQSRRRRNLRHAKLYANADLASIYDCGIASGVYDGGVYLTRNIVQSVVDTLISKITRQKARGQFVTERGSWSQIRRAEGLTRFVDGVYTAHNFYNTVGRVCFGDACLFSDGVVYAYDDDGDVRLERVLPDELLIDETEGINGIEGLRSVYRKKFVHREVALDLWGDTQERRDAISTTRVERPVRTSLYSSSENMLPIYAAWHLPTRRGGDDGRWVIACDGGELASGKWARSDFPFRLLPYMPPVTGVWGRSLAEALVPIQIKINDLIQVIDEGERLACGLKVFVEEGSVNKDLIDNSVATMIEYAVGHQAPTYYAPPGPSPQLYQSLQEWWSHGFEIAGISQASASGEKPPGTSSAVAMREALDNAEMRLAVPSQNYEWFCGVAVPELIVSTADEIYDTRKKLSVQVPGRDFIQTIDWKQVNLPRDRYLLQATPTSSLPTTPAAKKQYVEELFAAGDIDQATKMELLDIPDVRSVTTLLTSARNHVEKAIDDILSHGRFTPPDVWDDLELAKSLGLQAYHRAQDEGAPDGRLDLLARYIDEATALQSGGAGQATAAEPPPAEGQAPAAEAPAGPPPTQGLEAAQPGPADVGPVEQPPPM